MLCAGVLGCRWFWPRWLARQHWTSPPLTYSYIDALCRKLLIEIGRLIMGTNLVLGPPEKFYRRNPSGTFRDVHWYHLGDPKKVPGAPSQGFLIFLGFDKNITKIEIWLWYPHFWADFQVSYHFGKLLTARSQGFTASKNQSLDQWDMSISKMKILTP